MRFFIFFIFYFSVGFLTAQVDVFPNSMNINATGAYQGLTVSGSTSYPIRADWSGNSLGSAIVGINHGNVGDGIQAISNGANRSALFASANNSSTFSIYSLGSKNYFEGYVGIGETTPSFALDVAGSARFTGNIEDVFQIKSDTDLEFIIDKNNSSSLLGFYEIINGAGNHIFWVNENGDAKIYRNLYFDDGTVQKTAGPVAMGLLDIVDVNAGTVNVVGTASLTATYNSTDNYIEVTYSEDPLDKSTYLVQVTPIRINTGYATLDRSSSIYYSNGKVRIYVWDDNVQGAVANDCHITISKLVDGSPLASPPVVGLTISNNDENQNNNFHEEINQQNKIKSSADDFHENRIFTTDQLNETIENQQKTIELLEDRLSKLEGLFMENKGNLSFQNSVELKTAKLYQNQPNPFNQITEIKYFIPSYVENARLIISNLNGQFVKEIEIKERGEGKTIVNNKLVGNGHYQYSLIVDGGIIESKKMIMQN